MNSFFNIIFSKDTGVVVLMFILAVFLSLKIEDMNTDKNTLYPLLGVIPSIIIFIFYFVKPTVKNNSKK